MCGIVGYIGKQRALPILLDGIRSLEYRGYDSAGFAVLSHSGRVVSMKAVGRVINLENKIQDPEKVHGSTGIIHCLHPDTVVQLADGRTKRIKDIQDGQEVINLNVQNRQGSLDKGMAKVYAHPAPDDLYSIRTPLSNFLATGEHKTLVYTEQGIVEKSIEDIAIGDLLPTPSKIEVDSSRLISFEPIGVKRYYSLTSAGYAFIKNKLAVTGNQLVSKQSGVSLSYIGHLTRNDRNFREDQLRLWCGNFDQNFDEAKYNYFRPTNTIHGKFINFPETSSSELMQILGYYIGDGYAGDRSLRFKDVDRGVLATYKDLIKKVFNVDGRIGDMGDTMAGLLECNSFYLCEWLKRYIKEKEDTFLSSVGSLPEDQLAGFIRGLFDAEGYVALRSRQLGIGMNNNFLMRSLQLWLLRFGIVSSFSTQEPDLRYNKPNKSHKLLISNKESLQKFQDCIGFGSAVKNKKLKGLVPSMSDRRLSFSAPNNFREIIVSRVIEVKKIPSDADFVYDLEILGSHNFLANGIFTHNSRWSTHGQVTEKNAHPHHDCSQNIWLVHNGIIENYKDLKTDLEKLGHKFLSETDTEVIVHLVEEFRNKDKDLVLEEALRLALLSIRGTYGIAVVDCREPQKLVAARNFSPLLLGIGGEEYFVASDASAVLKHTKNVIYLDDGEMAVLTPHGHKIFDLKRNFQEKPIQEIEWTIEQSQKGGHPHFMLKEIMEEPEAIENSLRGRLAPSGGFSKLGGLSEILNKLKAAKRILISCCGTAYFAGRVGEYMLEEYAGIPAEVDFASEFRYRKPVFREGDVFLAISQSGETADTLAALREAKEKGILTLGIVNVVGSTMARDTDAGVYQHIGPEIGVASTKAFTSQVAILALLTLLLGRQREMSVVTGERIVKELQKIPDLMRVILKQNNFIKKLASKYQKHQNFLYLGRKYNLPVAFEGALKLKEISYVHAEGCGAGEMKHGPIAMIDENFPSIFIAPQDSVYEKMISNIEEVKARRGPVIAIATEGDERIRELADDVIYIPKTLEILTPLLSVVPLQLFAYHFGVLRGLDVDKPRNLAKSVTVE